MYLSKKPIGFVCSDAVDLMTKITKDYKFELQREELVEILSVFQKMG